MSETATWAEMRRALVDVLYALRLDDEASASDMVQCLEGLHSRVAALEAALRRYADHDECECAVWVSPGHDELCKYCQARAALGRADR
jgi:hypothetical protein